MPDYRNPTLTQIIKKKHLQITYYLNHWPFLKTMQKLKITTKVQNSKLVSILTTLTTRKNCRIAASYQDTVLIFDSIKGVWKYSQTASNISKCLVSSFFKGSPSDQKPVSRGLVCVCVWSWICDYFGHCVCVCVCVSVMLWPSHRPLPQWVSFMLRPGHTQKCPGKKQNLTPWS